MRTRLPATLPTAAAVAALLAVVAPAAAQDTETGNGIDLLPDAVMEDTAEAMDSETRIFAPDSTGDDTDTRWFEEDRQQMAADPDAMTDAEREAMKAREDARDAARQAREAHRRQAEQAREAMEEQAEAPAAQPFAEGTDGPYDSEELTLEGESEAFD